MNQLKATPGPWEASIWIEQPGNRLKPMVGASGVTIAITNPAPICQEHECEANAHLIAAAPEMYEVLDFAVSILESLEPHDDTLEARGAIIDAKKVLANARGEK